VEHAYAAICGSQVLLLLQDFTRHKVAPVSCRAALRTEPADSEVAPHPNPLAATTFLLIEPPLLPALHACSDLQGNRLNADELPNSIASMDSLEKL
jgi:hypothetical protein